jgi:REase_DpnII-MboI
VTAPPRDASPAMVYANLWLTAAAQRIAADAAQGSTDAQLARYFLGSALVPRLNQEGTRLTAAWLEENQDRLRQTPVIAAIGYGLAGALPGAQATARSLLVPAMQRLMSRNPFTDRLTFVYDLPQVVGIGLAAQAVAADLPGFSEWLADILHDDRLQPSDRFQALLREHVRSLLSGQTAAVHAQQGDDVSVFALRYWMASSGTAQPPDPAEHRELQKRIASETLRTDPAQLPVSRIALIYRAVTAILDASIEQAILSRSHLVTVLSRFETAMRRWRCDESSMKQPIRWPVTAEREVQDILWLMLRPVFDDLVEEETLPRLGHSTYRADFGIPSLGILIEVKYVRKSSDFKEIEKQVLEDSVAYLNGVTAYSEIVVFIYDESASVQEHDTTASSLRGIDRISDVIIVSRPSQLAGPALHRQPAVTAKPARQAARN